MLTCIEEPETSTHTDYLLLLVLLAIGCSDSCATQDYTDLTVGVGVRDFIRAPYGTQVTPGTDLQGPHFDIALSSYGLQREDLTVELQGFVGEAVVASARLDNVQMQCRRYGNSEVGNLRLPIDLTSLPRVEIPPPETPAPTPVTPIRESWDSGFRNWDSGWWWEDSGFRRWDSGGPTFVGTPDFRLVATVTESFGRVTVAETTWIVDR